MHIYHNACMMLTVYHIPQVIKCKLLVSGSVIWYIISNYHSLKTYRIMYQYTCIYGLATNDL